MLKAWAAKGVAPPAEVVEILDEPAEDEPVLDHIEAGYMMLFNDASTCRPPAFAGIPPIPSTAIRQVLRDRDWPEDDTEWACDFIRQLDAETLSHYADKKG